MSISIEVKDAGCVCLTPEGNLEHEDVHTLETAVENLIGKNQIRIVLDMSHVQSIDSAGLGVIILMNRKLTEATGRLCLCCIAEPVQYILSTTRLDRILQIHATLQEAMDAC